MYSSIYTHNILNTLNKHKQEKDLTEPNFKELINDLCVRIANHLVPSDMAEYMAKKMAEETNAASRARAQLILEEEEENGPEWTANKHRAAEESMARMRSDMAAASAKKMAVWRKDIREATRIDKMDRRSWIGERTGDREEEKEEALATLPPKEGPSRLTRKARGGSRRRKRKATRKLRKHYKSRKSTHKHIRRKK